MNAPKYYRHDNLLFSPDLIQRVLEHFQPLCTDKDFPVSKGLSVRDEAQRAYRIARAAWYDFSASSKDVDSLRRFVGSILTGVLGYDTPHSCPSSGIPAEYQMGSSLLFPDSLAPADGSSPQRLFSVTLLTGCGKGCFTLPVIAVPPDAGLDEKFSFPTGDRMTPMQAMQNFLNDSEAYLWGLVTNGSHWRLLRDNFTLSRPCFFDIDLELILQEDDSAAFDSLFWRMLHSSRADRQPERGPESCLWEQWRQDLEEHGSRAREGLRAGVEEAICRLGTGFLRGEGEGNAHLREQLRSGALSAQDFYCQLMRLAYRLIFLSVLEERGQLHEHARADAQGQQAAALYKKGYSLARLISRAERAEHLFSRFDDLWQAQLIVFRALGQDAGAPQLALPALGGIFSPEQCADLDACRLPNSAFLAALHFLRWTSTENKRTLVDFINMDAEEFGSVYESLLELTPRVNFETSEFFFAGGAHDPATSAKKQKGNARKTTGSYYTPSNLVQQVLVCALDPLLETCCQNPAEAQQKILDLRIIDPACGSGHFLLAAARRMAERLAAARSRGQEGYTPQDFRQAMHDVIRNCIYGVDINPMAVELARMNLWLEGYEPGKALSFLDDHLRCGNSLLGFLSPEALALPIPDAAFACNPGDDKASCRRLAAVNRSQAKERDKSADVLACEQPLPPQLGSYSEYQPSQVQQQARDWAAWHKELMVSPQALAADIWLGAFLLPKSSAASPVPTTGTLDFFDSSVFGSAEDAAAVSAARRACRESQVFHWFLEFPEVAARGGFDCVLGNPPWEKVQMKEEEWFADRHESIARAAGATRKKYIKFLSKGLLYSVLNDQDGGAADTPPPARFGACTLRRIPA